MRQEGYILVIEPDDLIGQLLERWLQEAGYAVVVAAAAPPVMVPAPRLVVANVPRPRSAAEFILSLQLRHAAPILALSARFRRGLGASVEVARRLGVCRVLPKPFTREEVLAAVAESIGGP